MPQRAQKERTLLSQSPVLYPDRRTFLCLPVSVAPPERSGPFPLSDWEECGDEGTRAVRNQNADKYQRAWSMR